MFGAWVAWKRRATWSVTHVQNDGRRIEKQTSAMNGPQTADTSTIRPRYLNGWFLQSDIYWKLDQTSYKQLHNDWLRICSEVGLKAKLAQWPPTLPESGFHTVSVWRHCPNMHEARVSGLAFLEVVSPPLADLFLLLRLVPSALDLWFGPRRRA